MPDHHAGGGRLAADAAQRGAERGVAGRPLQLRETMRVADGGESPVEGGTAVVRREQGQVGGGKAEQQQRPVARSDTA